jgi:hypothetical protein
MLVIEGKYDKKMSEEELKAVVRDCVVSKEQMWIVDIQRVKEAEKRIRLSNV